MAHTMLEKKDTISFPPSQVVELLVKQCPDHSLTEVIGTKRPRRLSDIERRERQRLKATGPAPHMTKMVSDIGFELVQEAAHADIINGRNLQATVKQDVSQLKSIWETVKKNEPYKLKLHTCRLCKFQSESHIVMSMHKQTPHYDGRKYSCGFCEAFDTKEGRVIKHYIEVHKIQPLPREVLPAKASCGICEEDFAYKGQRDVHMRMCKQNISELRPVMAPAIPDHVNVFNRWLWDKEKPERKQQGTVDQGILAQQQKLVNQQQKAEQVITMNNRKRKLQHEEPAQQKRPTQHISMQHQQESLQQNQNANNTLKANNKSTKAEDKIPKAENETSKANNSTSSSTRSNAASPAASILPQPASQQLCEICDQNVQDRGRYLNHLQLFHRQMVGKTDADMQTGAPLACSRCRERFWTYEGLERHLVMSHGLVTSDLLAKAQKKKDGGRCKLCGKKYAFNMLQHLVADHDVKLCSYRLSI